MKGCPRSYAFTRNCGINHMTANDAKFIDDYDRDAFLKKFVPGTSVEICRLRARIAVYNAAANVPLVRNILIIGESGAGKNYVAEVMSGHRQWMIDKSKSRFDDRLEKPLSAYTSKFIEVSLPGLPDELVESELFGHRQGSFTGAYKDHPGIFGEEYDDVLLDEIGDASARLQAKLLRVLNSGQYRPVGGTKEHEQSADARIIMATHRPLADLASSGIFRPDLLWRIREFILNVPALREQPENLPARIEGVLARLTDLRPEGLEPNPSLSDEDIVWATRYPWPGNVRQLRHALAKWLVYRGSKRLQDVVAEGEQDGVTMRAPPAPAIVIDRAVTDVLERARRNRSPLSDTVGDFLRTFETDAKRAMAKWVTDVRPTKEELEAMFTKQATNDIRTTVSHWRAQ